jgi:hypothetical protein
MVNNYITHGQQLRNDMVNNYNNTVNTCVGPMFQALRVRDSEQQMNSRTATWTSKSVQDDQSRQYSGGIRCSSTQDLVKRFDIRSSLRSDMAVKKLTDEPMNGINHDTRSGMASIMTRDQHGL